MSTCFNCGGPGDTATQTGHSVCSVCYSPDRDLDTLLRRVHTVWTDYVVFPSEHESVFLALWSAHTYVIGSAECTPYVWVNSSEYESGKTRTLEVAKALVREPLMSSTITPAVLYRIIEEKEPTLLIDEMDSVFGRGAEKSETALALRQVLNAGYRRGNPAYRMVGHGKSLKVEGFQTFGPKAMAGLQHLPDSLASRCVSIRLERKTDTEVVQPFRIRKVRERCAGLVADLEEWALGAELDSEPTATPPGLSDRQLDYWEPLLVIAEAAGGDWPKRARQAATHLADRKPSDEPSLRVVLLQDLREIWADDEPHLFSATVCERLRSMEESPWGDYYGREFIERDLAKLLRGWDISSKDVRIGAEVRKGYARDDLVPKWARYLDPQRSATSATRATPLVEGTENVAPVADVAPNSATGTELSLQDFTDECADCPKCEVCGFGPDRHLPPPHFQHAPWCEYHPDKAEETVDVW